MSKDGQEIHRVMGFGCKKQLMAELEPHLVLMRQQHGEGAAHQRHRPADVVNPQGQNLKRLFLDQPANRSMNYVVRQCNSHHLAGNAACSTDWSLQC
jgi:hypothetical protein